MNHDWLMFSDEQKEIIRILIGVDRNTKVLDVGCGMGRNIDLLHSCGFANVFGVDINPELVASNVRRGLRCFTPDELQDEAGFDMLVMSHVIEHFDHHSLLAFISSYLQRIKPGGLLLLVTPLPTAVFYNDFDHVRPYLPIGLDMVYGSGSAQVQFQADAVLELEDIRFYRLPYRLQFYRRFFVKQACSMPLWINRTLKLLYAMSHGLIGLRSGWIGLYRYHGARGGGAT